MHPTRNDHPSAVCETLSHAHDAGLHTGYYFFNGLSWTGQLVHDQPKPIGTIPHDWRIFGSHTAGVGVKERNRPHASLPRENMTQLIGQQYSHPEQGV